MLPDFSETKRLFSRFFQTYARRKARAISPLADVQVRYLHEGRGMKVMRADQSESNTGMQLDAELVLQMLETIQLEFYPDGRPHELHVVGGLFSPERLKAVDEEFQN